MTEYHVDLATARKQVKQWAYDVLNDENGKPMKGADGKNIRLPNPKKVKEFIEGLYECMSLDEWEAISAEYKDVIFPNGATNQKRRGRPRDRFHGLTQTEINRKEREIAANMGVWHVRYPHGCTECGRCDYKHFTGGICTRCYKMIREAGITIKQYRSAGK